MERLGDQDQDIIKDVVVEAFEHWSLQVLTFLAGVQSLAEGFPFLPALHYFFQLNLKLAWHMRSRPAITIEWNFLHKLDLEMIYSKFNQIHIKFVLRD